jgi:hypothetical protein
LVAALRHVGGPDVTGDHEADCADEYTTPGGKAKTARRQKGQLALDIKAAETRTTAEHLTGDPSAPDGLHYRL